MATQQILPLVAPVQPPTQRQPVPAEVLAPVVVRTERTLRPASPPGPGLVRAPVLVWVVESLLQARAVVGVVVGAQVVVRVAHPRAAGGTAADAHQRSLLPAAELVAGKVVA